MKKVYAPVFLLFLFLLKTNFSFSQPGFLDASFGNGGKVVMQTGVSRSNAEAIAITPDGKILVGGNELDTVYLGLQLDKGNLLQYNSDGTLDSAFGVDGKISPSLIAQTTIYSIAIQNDGKIIVSGDGGNITRYNKNGSVDTTFGNHGFVSTAFTNGYIFIRKIIIRPDGKILVGGTVPEAIFESYPAFAQYLPNGSLDSTFGTNGIVEKKEPYSPIHENPTRVNDMAITVDGKIIAVINVSSQGQGETDFLMYKLLPNGAIDSTFGTNGALQTDVDSLSDDNAFGIVALPDNSFVVTGVSVSYGKYPTYTNGIALVKYYPNGSLDSTFGANGKVLSLPFPNKSVFGNHILSSPDGSLFVSGSTGFGYSYPEKDFLVAKYHANGSLDSSFGTYGITTTDFSGNSDISYSSALQPDGKIVLVGSTGSDADYNIALARYSNAFVYPLRLLSFTAIKNGSVNLLQWQTAQEMNIDKFDVQRSGNARDYIAIETINAGTGTYHFADTKPLPGSNYYRLKMIDKDETFTYSAVKEITNNTSFTVMVYPNPVKDELQVQVSSGKEDVVQLNIISNDGKQVLATQCTVAAGLTSKAILVAALQKGNYYLVVRGKDKKQVVIMFEKL